MQSHTHWIGRTVDFDVLDAFNPTPAEVLMQRYANQIMQGRVVDVTTDAKHSEQYAVLRVGGVQDFVIVPCRKLRGTLLKQAGPSA